MIDMIIKNTRSCPDQNDANTSTMDRGAGLPDKKKGILNPAKMGMTRDERLDETPRQVYTNPTSFHKTNKKQIDHLNFETILLLTSLSSSSSSRCFFLQCCCKLSLRLYVLAQPVHGYRSSSVSAPSLHVPTSICSSCWRSSSSVLSLGTVVRRLCLSVCLCLSSFFFRSGGEGRYPQGSHEVLGGVTARC